MNDMEKVRLYANRLRYANSWVNNGRCCGQRTLEGACPDGGCMMTEVCAEFVNASNVIVGLMAEIEKLRNPA